MRDGVLLSQRFSASKSTPECGLLADLHRFTFGIQGQKALKHLQVP